MKLRFRVRDYGQIKKNLTIITQKGFKRSLILFLQQRFVKFKACYEGPFFQKTYLKSLLYLMSLQVEPTRSSASEGPASSAAASAARRSIFAPKARDDLVSSIQSTLVQSG
jgi:hypothetical protein